MAASIMSMSESIQASIIIHHQLQQQNHQLPSPYSQLQPKGIQLCTQAMLVSASFAIEMCISFEQIYQILILQYLGVPLSMVSINGIVCGGTSMILLPILGFVTDRGTNPKLRKLLSLFVGMGMFLCGLCLLVACGFIKLASKDVISFENITHSINNTPTYFPNISRDITTTDSTNLNLPTRETTQLPNHEPENTSGLPITAFMSIIGFALIDIGFDMSVSLTRAFILEITSATQHTRLLVMATVMASMAGTTFSFIGCFDFPEVLGSLFQVEGVAATLIFFCCLLFCVLIIGYSFTAVTGLLINVPKQLEKTHTQHKEPSNQLALSRDTATPRTSRRRVLKGRTHSQLHQLHENRPYVPDIHHTEERDLSTRPLLLEDSATINNYSAITGSSSFRYQIKDASEADTPTKKTVPRNILITTSIDNPIQGETTNLEFAENEENMDELSDLDDIGALMNEHSVVDNGISAVLAAIKQSYSMSISVKQPPLGEFHNRKLEQLKGKNLAEGKKSESKIFSNKRLVILTISSFFTNGSSLGFIIYSSNTLNIGILGGDPTALPGSEGYKQYERGLQTAALGNLVLYCSYMIVSISNNKIIDLIGEKVQFVLCHVLLMITLLVLIIVKRVEAYFVFMVFCGAFRTCAFTLPFVLANKFTQEEKDKDSPDFGKPAKNLGQVMSLIGFLMPAHFILMSTFMGPLMDATGDVWVPLIYSMCSSSISLIIFSSLFFIKN
uniref:Uncharacterized protein n=1 Tax=Arion vulgaris TaxID=1028688 RepID=A0A0B7A8V8_9EUPU